MMRGFGACSAMRRKKHERAGSRCSCADFTFRASIFSMSQLSAFEAWFSNFRDALAVEVRPPVVFMATGKKMVARIGEYEVVVELHQNFKHPVLTAIGIVIRPCGGFSCALTGEPETAARRVVETIMQRERKKTA